MNNIPDLPSKKEIERTIAKAHGIQYAPQSIEGKYTAIDDKTIAEEYVKAQGGIENYLKKYTDWTRQYGNALSEASKLKTDDYKNKDSFSEYGEKVYSLSKRGNTFNKINQALGLDVPDISESLASAPDFSKSLSETSKYFAQWDTEDDYNNYIKASNEKTDREKFDEQYAGKGYAEKYSSYEYAAALESELEKQKGIRSLVFSNNNVDESELSAEDKARYIDIALNKKKLDNAYTTPGYENQTYKGYDGLISQEEFEYMQGLYDVLISERKDRYALRRQEAELREQQEANAEIVKNIYLSGASVANLVADYKDLETDEESVDALKKEIRQRLKAKGYSSAQISDILEYAEGERNQEKISKIMDELGEELEDANWLQKLGILFENNLLGSHIVGAVTSIVDNVGEIFTTEMFTGEYGSGYNHAYAGGNYLNQFISAKNQTVSESIENPAMRSVVDFTTSTIQSASTLLVSAASAAAIYYVSGGTASGLVLKDLVSGVGATMFGITSAGSTMTDVVSRGGTPQQALSLGVLSGAIETATEKLQLDKLVDIFTKTDVTKGFLRNVFSSGLKQMPAEAGEEFISQMAGYITDLGVMGWDESQIGEMWRNNVSSGLSESDAAAQTFLDILGGATYAGLGGAFSGFVMGGSTSTLAQTINYFGNRNTGKKIVKKNMAEPLLKYASGVTVSDANMQKQLASILEQQKQSNADIGKVFSIVSNNATQNLQAEVNSLGGVSQNTDLTKAVTKSLLGAPLSSSEQSLVNSDSGITLLYKASRSQAYADAQTVFGFLKESEQQNTETQDGDVSSTPTAAMGGTSDSGDASASVSGLPASDVASPDDTPAANVPTANQNGTVANVGDVETGSDSVSPYDEPDLTDTSGVDTYDRLAQQMMDKPFVYTEQHKHVEQVAKRLGRNLYWDCKFGNGYIDGNGDIHLAPDTKSPISKVFKHELTHFLQKNQQMYNRFANAVMDSQIFRDWVRSKGYNSNEAFANHIIETYQAAEQERQRTNPDAPEITINEGKAYQEMLADFVGEKMFGGNNKITERLLNALEDRPRQSFVDTIRRWVAKVKSALKGTKEGKTIADFEQEFIAAYKAAQKTSDSEGAKNTAQAEGQYDIGVLDNGNTYVIASRRVINGTTLKDQRADITAFFKKLLQNKPSLDIPTIEGDVLTITMAETAQKARDNYKTVAGMPVKMSDNEFRVKLNVEAHIDEIAETSIPDKRPPTKDTKNHSFAKDGFRYRTAYFEDFDGQYYKIRFSVGENGTVATVYNVGKIEGSVPSSAKLIAVVGSKALNGSLPNDSISKTNPNVNKNSSTSSSNSNSQYSITIEAEYMQAVEKGDEETAQRLVNEAAERAMSDSKARDMDGELTIVYHGTEAEKEFYVFDKARQGQTDSGMFGKGFYFTADYDYAEMFSEENPNNKPRVFFLNITNPFEISAISAPASEIANKLIDLGVSVDFDYRGLEAHEFANKFGNKRFSDTLQELGYDGVIVNDGFEYVVFDQNQMKSADAITYDDNSNVIPLEQRFDYGSNDVRYSIDINDEVPNIKINMSEDQRYEVLKDKKIQPQNIEVDKEFDISFEYLENNIKSIIEKPLVNKLRELGYLRKYRTSVIDVDFEFTGGGLRKSLNSQIMDYGGSFADLAKVVLNLQVLLDNSVLLEIHSDKGKGTSRENPQLIQTYVLLGAFREDNVIKPVQFEVKQYVDDSNRLYLAVALTKIETGVMGNTILDENQASTYLLPVSAISIPDLVAQINPRDAKLLKYIPNQFLSERQIDAKNIEIAKDAEKYSDSKKDQYSLSVETAADLLEQYEQGKITKEEYLSRISRRKVSNPAQIASLTPDDASTTPDFPEITYEGKQDGKSRFYTNVKEKAKYVRDTVKDIVTDDSFIKHYATITNKETLAKAAKKLDEGGAALVQEWSTKDERNMTAEDISIGLILIERYQVEGNYSAVINVMRKMRKAGTIAGQAVQSFALLGRLDPTSMQMYMQKELDEAYEAMVEGKTNKWIQENKEKFELTAEEMDYIRRRTLQAATATDSRAKDIAIAEIIAMVSNKTPHEKGMALKSLMRTSMLFNLKTQVRNVLGNVSMVPAHWASDLVGTAIDSITAKFTGYRTKGINIATRKNGEAFIRGAREAFEDYRLGIDTRQDLDRFDIGQGKAFNDQHSGIASIINPVSRALNRIDRFNSFLLELGDRPFFEYWFTNSLENQMRLNGVTEPTAEMLEIAEQEALTRVWQDTNKFTKSVTTIKKILNQVNVKGYGLGDVFIKFVKTPANLTKAMVDFSPVGLIQGVVDIVRLNRSLETGIGNSKIIQSQMVKNLSNGIVGTLLYIAFYALAAGLVKGVTVSGAPDDDDDVNAFNKEVLGRYPYTISIGDYSFSYDWMSPIGSMLSTAKSVVDATENDRDILTTTRHAIQASSDVLFNQSFMKSIQEVLTNRDGYWAGAEKSIIDEPAVLIPQFVAQFASSLDEYQRETYQKDDAWQTMLNDVLYKLPWLRETLEPKLDALGREVANPRGDLFNAFLNPANTYASNNTETAEEVYRLYESTGEASVMYPKAPRSVTHDGVDHTLTIKERNQYQKTLGTISDRNIDTLMHLGIYKEMTDAERVRTITDIYEYARAIAKSEYLGDESSLSTKHKKIKALEDEGVISATEYLMLAETSDTDGNNYLTNAELNKGLQTYIEDMRTRQLVKQLYRAKGSEIEGIIENYNN